MRSDVFYWVLNMSIFGSILCLIVLLLRRCRRLPKLFVYGLWALPFLRLVCPVGVTGRYNLMELLVRLGVRRVPASAVLGLDDAILVNFSGANGILQAQSYSPVVLMNSIGLAQAYDPVCYGLVPALNVNMPAMQPSNPVQTIMETGALIWLVVAVGLLVIAGMLCCFTAMECRGAGKMDGYYVSNRVQNPAVYGVLRQRIVIPAWVRQEDIPHILRHERVHMRRRDNFWRLLAVAVCCVHWFNPLCWISLKYFLQDMELACDEAVLRPLSQQERRDYAYALLNTSGEKGLFSSAFGGAKITARVERIVSYKRLTWLSVAALSVLFAVLAYMMVTN